MRRHPASLRHLLGRPPRSADGKHKLSYNWRYRQTRRERRVGRPTRSRLGAATAKKLVVQLAIDELLHGLGGELLTRPRQVILRKLVEVAGELGRDEHAEILVACLLCDFTWGDNAWVLLLMSESRQRELARVTAGPP